MESIEYVYDENGSSVVNSNRQFVHNNRKNDNVGNEVMLQVFVATKNFLTKSE